MNPENPLPYNTSAFPSADAYIDSLLHLITSNDLLKTLCGGVHVLDFFTSDPDLYSRLLPQEWRDFFSGHEMMDILDLLMREDLEYFSADGLWRGGRAPAESLVEYVALIRRHSFDREPKSMSRCAQNRVQKKLDRHVTVGMNVKKVHEVGIFASYIDRLATYVSNKRNESGEQNTITNLVDFGSGQSYLGRALASEPYNRSIVAIERKSHNADRAKELDVAAKLVEKNWVRRNKKAFRAGLISPDRKGGVLEDLPTPLTPPPEKMIEQDREKLAKASQDGILSEEAKGRVQHIEHQIQNGDLTDVVSQIRNPTPNDEKNLLVISLHSCGNLIHHGLRSLTLNPNVKAVALVGCCYNLLTERLGPATYKHPELLRPTTHSHPRLEKEGEAHDPHGFPMSERFCNYSPNSEADSKEKGIRLNITARMMAVQAPANWGERDSESFFTRHFYRALLQKVFLDRGVVGPPSPELQGEMSPAGHTSSGGTPILIGALRKSCYASFPAYVRGALDKLYDDPKIGALVRERMSNVTDTELVAYEERFRERKKDLSVVWSLMAFSAGVIEAAIVVDRFLWLQEQEGVGDVWVEAVFEYGISPRNVVLVGVKK